MNAATYVLGIFIVVIAIIRIIGYIKLRVLVAPYFRCFKDDRRMTVNDRSVNVNDGSCMKCGGAGKVPEYGEMHYPPGYDQNCYGGGGDWFQPYADVVGELPCSACGGTGKIAV